MLGFLAGVAAGAVMTGVGLLVAAVYILDQSGDLNEGWWD